MADRRNDISSKSTNPRSGISLTNLSEPLSFGPALVPTLQPVGTSGNVSSSSQPTTTSSSSPSTGLFPMDADAEVDSFLGQQPSPPSSSSSSQTPQSKPTAMSSFLSTPASASSSAQQSKAQPGPRHFTMSGSGHDTDSFVTSTTKAAPMFAQSAASQTPTRPQMSYVPTQPAAPRSSGVTPMPFTANQPTGQAAIGGQPMFYTPPPMSSSQSHIQRPPMSYTAPMPTMPPMQAPMSTPPRPPMGATSMPPRPPMGTSTTPLHPPTGTSSIPSRRIYPEMNSQDSYSKPQFPTINTPPFPPPVGSSTNQPTPQFVDPSLGTQAPQPTYSPVTFTPSMPEYQTQPFMPQDTQQVPPYPGAGEAPVLPVAQQECVVPSILVAPVQPHWFYLKEGRIWMPFSYIDSDTLEHANRLPGKTQDRVVPTNGGRYDVNLEKRTREAVYWEEPATVVRRCTWFYKAKGGTKVVPYDEELADKLENEFQATVHSNLWPRRIDLNEGEYVIIHNTNVMVHFKPSKTKDWSGEDIKAIPVVVRRGIFDIEDDIEDGEPSQIDHLVFVVHGIGPVADLRFRNIVECVDDLRIVSLSMLNEHHDELAKGRSIGRIEYLPVQWHSKLHNDSTGVDEKLHSISLQSITKLRAFTNSTILDVLFYTSPTYCQTIVDIVGADITRLLDIFKKRNPLFKGNISVCGHSLGSSIMFDILYHQQHDSKPPVQSEPAASASVPANPESSDDEEEEEEPSPALDEVLHQLGLQDYEALFESEKIDLETLLTFSESDIKEIGLPMGPRKKITGYLKQHALLQEKRNQEKATKAKAKAEAKATRSKDIVDSGSTKSLVGVESVEVLYHLGVAGTGQPNVKYPKLEFKPFALFALGSPIGMFMTVRGVNLIGPDYQLPTCPRFYNIFHPIDPVAFRVEPLVDSTFALQPVMLPHHKGRKRMHLELRDNLSRFGAQLKATLVETVRSTIESINEFARAHTTSVSVDTEDETPPSPAPSISSDSSEDERARHELTIKIGQLNGGERIDYVLQEKPIESLNEYLFALSSHVCYWLSEDTALFMLREIYKDAI